MQGLAPMLDHLTRHWWTLAVRGLAAVTFGLIALAWPGLTLSTLIIVFGLFAIVNGLLHTFAAVRVIEADGSWWALLAESVLSTGAGLVALVWPGLTALALLYLIAAWAIATGILEVTAAIRLRQEIRGEWFLATSGIASITFGAVAAILPGAGALALIWLIGIYAIVFGGVLIALAVRLRELRYRNRRGGQTGDRADPLASY
jgi:uncharacterized membrane protein HdeD (DUF308 family)